MSPKRNNYSLIQAITADEKEVPTGCNHNSGIARVLAVADSPLTGDQSVHSYRRGEVILVRQVASNVTSSRLHYREGESTHYQLT